MTLINQGVWATTSLRFFGNGTGDIDRVKIQIDDPSNALPGPPADIGAEDFTLEFWMKAASGNNATASNSLCGTGWYSWINGNIIIDRDRNNQGRNYGLSIVNGVIWFGLENGGESFPTSHTLCGTTNVLDGQWHHVGAQRRRSDGFIWLYVDGNLEASANGPDGDISYPDNVVPQSCCINSDPFLVIGAEKHDFPETFAYSGHIDELRLSNSLRYSGNFSVPTSPFTTDANTMALYSFDEGIGTDVLDTSGIGPSHGVMNVGGSPAGPVWSTDTPFGGGNPVPGTIQFTETAASIGEAGGSRSFSVSRTGGSGMVSIAYVIGATGSTATMGVDYESNAQAATGALSWADGDTSPRTLIVAIVDDNDSLEGDEAVVLSLSNPTNGASLGFNASATLTIQDNDAPGTLQFATTSQSVNEGAGTAILTVTRTSGNVGLVSVNYSITGASSAIAGADYQNVQPMSGILTFADGQNSATITLTVVDDSDPEPLKTVNFSLSGPTGGAVLGSRSSMVLGIVDNDAPPGGDSGSLGASGAFDPLLLGLVVLLWSVRRRRVLLN